MEDKEVVYIDDTPEARNSYVQELEDIFGDEVSVTTISPEETREQMLATVLEHSCLASLVIDERLNDTGLADYTGIALSEVVRARFPKLPIYILTNYPDDIVEGGYNVEYVFDKNELTSLEYKKTASARVRRHLNVYSDIFSEREQRYAELLPKFLGGGLDENEKKEFLDLEASRIKPLSHEFVEDEALKKRFDDQVAVLLEIRDKLEQGQ